MIWNPPAGQAARSPAMLLLLIGSLLLVPCCSKTADGPGNPAGPAPTSLSTLEQQAHAKINAYRTSKGLPALAWRDAIADQARQHSQRMADGNTPFGHDGFTDRMAAIGRTVPWSNAAENVAMNWNEPDPVAAAIEGWVASAGHRENLEGSYDLTGIGAARAANGALYFTQIFVRSR